MHDAAGIGLEYQQLAAGRLAAIDDHVVQAHPLVKGAQSLSVARAEPVVEIAHGLAFLGAVRRAFLHIGIEVVHHPALRDAQVRQVRLALHQHDAILAIESVAITIVDELGHEEVVAWRRFEISRQRVRRVDFRQALAGIGIDGPRQNGKLRFGQYVLQVRRTACQFFQRQAVGARQRGRHDARRAAQDRMQAVA